VPDFYPNRLVTVDKNRRQVCWSRECTLAHEANHAEEWRQIWEGRMAELNDDLGILISHACTQGEAEAELRVDIDQAANRAISQAYDDWNVPEGEERSLYEQRKCSIPKIVPICMKARLEGWNSCSFCYEAENYVNTMRNPPMPMPAAPRPSQSGAAR
jgi:hypothetical protein